MLLRSAVGMAAPQATVPALGAAELVGAALEAFAADPGLLAAEHARIGVLLVDDAQNLDPQAARLVRVLASGVDAAVLAGDPNQAVFGLPRGGRGRTAGHGRSDREAGDQSPLRAGDRAGRDRGRAAAARPRTRARHRRRGRSGRAPFRRSSPRPRTPKPRVVADALRRAHLVDDVPWSQMAVIVRSVPRAGAGLPRALAAAGVPVAPPAMDRAAARTTRWCGRC